MSSRINSMLSVLAELRAGMQQNLSNREPLAAAPERLLSHIEWTRDDLDRFILDHHDRLETSLRDTLWNPESRQRIPPKTHKVWLTSEVTPSAPPAEYLNKWISDTSNFSGEWRHYFWTNSAQVVNLLQETLAKSTVRVEVRFVSSLFDVMLNDLITSLITDRKFVLAADIAKIAIVNEEGGIYSDLGVSYSVLLTELVRVVDYSMIFVSPGFFQLSFLAAPPMSQLLVLWRHVILNPQSVELNLIAGGRELQGPDEVGLFAGPGFSICAMLAVPRMARVLFLPPQSAYLGWVSQASWYGPEPKFGNRLVAGSPPTVFNHASTLARQLDVKAGIHVFGGAHRMALQILLILGALPMLDEFDSDACKLFYYHGSDKAKSWHNYSLLYNYILPAYLPESPTVMEVGIGTTYLDVRSSMGPTAVPGASLRAWREFLRARLVVGCDIDSRILFRSEGIETFQLDQTDRASIRLALQQMSASVFDLIVDDGLHEFEANRILLEETIHAVSTGGIYIVEDITLPDVPRWMEYLAAANLEAVLVDIPHQINKNDNRILIILKQRP